MSHHTSFLLGQALRVLPPDVAGQLYGDVPSVDLAGVKRGMESPLPRLPRRERAEDLRALREAVLS